MVAITAPNKRRGPAPPGGPAPQDYGEEAALESVLETMPEETKFEVVSETENPPAVNVLPSTTRPVIPPRPPAVEIDTHQMSSEETWLSHYTQIKEFMTEFSRIPTPADTYQGAVFDTWITHYQYVAGTYLKTTLTDERIAMLMDIPGWKFKAGAYKRLRLRGFVLRPLP